MTTIVPVQTCRECGAQHANLTPECPLCGHDPRLPVILAAIIEGNREWDTLEQLAARVTAALDTLTREAYDTEDDDA